MKRRRLSGQALRRWPGYYTLLLVLVRRGGATGRNLTPKDTCPKEKPHRRPGGLRWGLQKGTALRSAVEPEA